MLAARKPKRWDPSTRAAHVVAQGWHGHHPSRADRGRAAVLARWWKLLCLARLEHRMFGHEPGGEIAPQRHDQLARQGDDGNALDPAAGAGRAGPEPLAERAVRLMQQPQPGELDRLVAGARIARLADPLLALDPAAAPRTGHQSAVAGDLAPIAEVLVEHLVHEGGREHRAEALEPEQEFLALCHPRRRDRR